MAYRKQNWDKQTWLKGQKNVENMLNHIEDGIAEGGSGSLPEGGNNGDVLTKVITPEIPGKKTLKDSYTYEELEAFYGDLEVDDYKGISSDAYNFEVYCDINDDDSKYYLIDYYTLEIDQDIYYYCNCEGYEDGWYDNSDNPLDHAPEFFIPDDLTEEDLLNISDVSEMDALLNIGEPIPGKESIKWRQGIPDTALANNGDVLTKVITPEIPSKKELKDSYTYEELEAFCGDIEEGDFKGVERLYYYDLNVRYYLAGDDSKYFMITYDDGDNTYYYNCNSPEHEDGWYDYGMGYVETTTPELFIPDDLTEDDFYNISDLSELDVLFNTTEPIPSKESIEWKQVAGGYDLELDFGELVGTSKEIDCDVSKILNLYKEGKPAKVLVKFTSTCTDDSTPFEEYLEFTNISVTKNGSGDIMNCMMTTFGPFGRMYGDTDSVIYKLYISGEGGAAFLSYSALSN